MNRDFFQCPLSPVKVRLIARWSNHEPRRTKEIAILSELSMQKVRWISGQSSWDNVRFREGNAFLVACGVTRSNMRRHVEYYSRTMRNKRGPMAHLDKLTSREKRRLLKLIH